MNLTKIASAKLCTVLTLSVGALTAFAIPHVHFELDEKAEQIVKNCENSSQSREISACINKNIKIIMEGELTDRYHMDLGIFADRYRLNNLEPKEVGNLYELFPVYIPLSNHLDESFQCIDFSSRSNLPKPEKIYQTSRALLKSALFIKKFATFSIGKPFSVVLGFDSVRVCENSSYDRLLRLDRENKSLEVGFYFRHLPTKGGVTGGRAMHISPPSSSGPKQNFTAELLWKEWQIGNALNPRPDTVRWVNSGIVPYILAGSDNRRSEFYYQKWRKINPTGELRTALRTIAWQFVHGTLDKISVSPKTFLKEIADRLTSNKKLKLEGFDVADTLNNIDQNFVDKFVQKMTDLSFISKVVTKHLATSANICSGMDNESEVQREAYGVINFLNQKDVSVYAQFDTPMPGYVDLASEVYENTKTLCVKSSLKNRDFMVGLININLIDNVSVSVIGLNRITDVILLLPQLALYDLIKNPFTTKP